MRKGIIIFGAMLVSAQQPLSRTSLSQYLNRCYQQDYYFEKSSRIVAMAILMTAGTAGVGGSTWSIAIADDADIPPSDDVSILSSSSVASSSSSSSTVIESIQPPSAISGKALVLPDVAANHDISTAGDLAAPGKNDEELLEELKSSATATTEVESSPLSPPPATSITSSSNGDMDLTKSDLAMKGQIQEEAPAAAASAATAAVVAEEQSSVAKLIDNSNDNDYDGDANSIAMISKMGYDKYNAAILPKPVENLALVVAPVAIVTALVLLASPSTSFQEDAGKSEDAVVDNIAPSTASGGEKMDNSNMPSTTLKGAEAMTDGKNTDQGRQKEWKMNAPVPYGLQESTPKWSSLPPPPPPPPKKNIAASVITPLFVSPSSTPTLAPEQVKETIIDRGGFRSSTTTSSFGTSTIGNESSSPSLSQAIKQPQKGTASMGGNSPPSSLSSPTSFAKQQQKGWSSTPPPTTTSTTTTTDSPVPKSFAKSAYKKSSLIKVDQRPQSFVAPNVAAATSSGGGNANAVPVSSSGGGGTSETMGRDMIGRTSTVPKNFAKSAYKKSSLNTSDQRPQSFVAPNVAASAASPVVEMPTPYQTQAAAEVVVRRWRPA
jgi:hypothetical protein